MQSSDPNRLTVERVGHVNVVRFPREVVLSGETARGVGQQLLPLVRQSHEQPLLLDAGNVRSLSSMLIAQLIELHREARGLGGRFALCNLRPDVLEILIN